MAMLELTFSRPVSGFKVLGAIITKLDPKQNNDNIIQLMESEDKPTLFAKIANYTAEERLGLQQAFRKQRQAGIFSGVNTPQQDILLLYSRTDDFELSHVPLTKRKDNRDIVATEFMLHYNGSLTKEFFERLGARAHKVM
jgi:hypothetical protein